MAENGEAATIPHMIFILVMSSLVILCVIIAPSIPIPFLYVQTQSLPLAEMPVLSNNEPVHKTTKKLKRFKLDYGIAPPLGVLILLATTTISPGDVYRCNIVSLTKKTNKLLNVGIGD